VLRCERFLEAFDPPRSVRFDAAEVTSFALCFAAC
jgi:hypothetical protein